MLDAAVEVGHELLNKQRREVVSLAGVDNHFANIFAQVIANGANDDVALLKQETGR